MEWIKKHIIGLVVAAAIILAAIIIARAITSSKVPAARDQPQSLSSGATYDITGDIIVRGMNIDSDKLNNILKKKTKSGEEVYTYILVNGKLPEEFAEEIKQVLTPNFVAQATGEMCVMLDLAVGDTTRKVEVKTGDYVTTLAYFLWVRNSNCVLFQAGEAPPSESAHDIGVFQHSTAYSIGDTIVGTPYNFVPLVKAEPNVPKLNPGGGELNVPPINEL